MPQIPFAPWMRGNRALDLVRNADGPKRSVAPMTYYSAVLRVHEHLSGEIWSAEAWVDVARTKLMQGDLRSAEDALCQADVMGTPNPDAPLMLAEILLATDRAERAHGLLKNIVAQRPLIARAHYLLGLACRDLGLDEEEADAYRTALAIDPDIGIAWYRLGNYLSLRKNWAEAVNVYREALRVWPDDEGTLFAAALALDRSGDPDSARRCLARLNEIESDLAPLLESCLEAPKPIPPGTRLRLYPRPSRKKGKGES